MKPRFIFLMFAFITVVTEVWGQETMFALLRKDANLGDDYFVENDFQDALAQYENALKKNPSAVDVRLKIARCHYHLKNYKEALEVYEQLATEKEIIPQKDIFYAAESYAATRNYRKASEWYRLYLVKEPDDPVMIKKIWQISNVHFLYEDSLHYALRPVRANTINGEFGGIPYRNGLVFLSNRKTGKVVEKLDGASNTPFYKLYYSKASRDTVNHSGLLQYSEPVPFSKDFNSKFHQGPAAFFDDERKMVYVSTSRTSNERGEHTLQLFFAERKGNRWKTLYAFPYNSELYSVTEPTISNDGRVLYFSSDMKGGLGGKDIYRSEYVNGKWTKPVNVGEPVNTPYDEVFPYLHGKGLYFSSDGHAGLGGLDIFKAEITSEGFFGEISNPGYPLNTNFDEFGIVMDSLGTFGYLSSNRKAGGYDDDIYEFDIDLQTYPLVITGHVKFKDVSWTDPTFIQPLPNAKLSLIDNIRNTLVHESYSDSTGRFSLQIPYYSKYRIHITGEDKEENIVSLEIPKHRKADSEHELVVIKDPFKTLHRSNEE